MKNLSSVVSGGWILVLAALAFAFTGCTKEYSFNAEVEGVKVKFRSKLTENNKGSTKLEVVNTTKDDIMVEFKLSFKGNEKERVKFLRKKVTRSKTYTFEEEKGYKIVSLKVCRRDKDKKETCKTIDTKAK